MIDNSLPEAPMGDEAEASGAMKLYIPSEGAAVGDEVECSVRGMVESLHGDVACIVPSEINGQPAPMAPVEEPAVDEHEALRQMAEDEDQLPY